jgi:pimeloyl-ACP methyl ester carboxylesterase
MTSVIRQLEGLIGGLLLPYVSEKLLRKAEMIKRDIVLPSGLTMHYYERLPRQQSETSNTTTGSGQEPPTLILCHGLTSEAKMSTKLVDLLSQQLPEWRMILPDMIGHGHDLERARSDSFEYPTLPMLVQSTRGLLEALHITKCCAYGISQGGSLVYFLQQKHPQLVEKAILISPALEAVMDAQFLHEFIWQKKNHICVESREDVQELFHNLSCPQRKVKDPVPAFLLEAVWQARKAREPPRHFRTFLNTLMEQGGKDPDWLGCSSDIFPTAHRLVIWPENDFICNHDKGKAFFSNSPATTFHSFPDCGHLFHSNGKTIMEMAAPFIIEYLLCR